MSKVFGGPDAARSLVTLAIQLYDLMKPSLIFGFRWGLLSESDKYMLAPIGTHHLLYEVYRKWEDHKRSCDLHLAITCSRENHRVFPARSVKTFAIHKYYSAGGDQPFWN